MEERGKKMGREGGRLVEAWGFEEIEKRGGKEREMRDS